MTETRMTARQVDKATTPGLRRWKGEQKLRTLACNAEQARSDLAGFLYGNLLSFRCLSREWRCPKL